MKHDTEIMLMIEYIVSEVTQLLMSEKGMSMRQALDTIYTSMLFRSIEKPELGLYYQSPVYIYDLLCTEINGKV